MDLARLAGLAPAGVICEILNPDGTMARRPELEVFAKAHGLTFVTVADLVAYRLQKERLVHRVATARLPTEFGEFRVIGYRNDVDSAEHVALVHGEVEGKERVLGTLRVLNGAIVRITKFVLGLTPIGVFAIGAVTAGTMAPETFVRLEAYFVAFVAASLLLAFWVLPLVAGCKQSTRHSALF